MDEFERHFFQGEALERIFISLCNSCTNEISDPITYTLNMFLTIPLCLNVTKTGIAPFQDNNTIILPYVSMTEAQKAFVLRMIDLMQEEGMGLLSTQMGGGGMAVLNYRGPKRYLNHAEVLVSFYRVLRRSHKFTDPQIQRNLCNIAIQRVCSMVHICRETLNRVHQEIQS